MRDTPSSPRLSGGTLFSGIGAPELAAPGIDWRWCAEIEPFACAVHKTRFQGVPNLGDVTKIDPRTVEPVDIIVFGSPCQSFSVAGKRRGLDDPRGDLALIALRLVAALRPRWFLFENVPGLLSSEGGRDFGAFVGAVEQCGYGWSYRTLDAQHFGVPQRRRRVFVVGCLGDWRGAAAVLFEPASLRGDPAPGREAGQGVAPTIGRGTPEGSGAGAGWDRDFFANGGLVASSLKRKESTPDRGDGCDNLIAHSLTAEGFDASEDGTGRGPPLVAQTLTAGYEFDFNDEKKAASHLVAAVPPLMARSSWGGTQGLSTGFTNGSTAVPAVAFALGSHAGAAGGEVTNHSHANGGPVGSNVSEESAYALRSDRTQNVASAMTVRRLTPREAERLQGFADDFTAITYRGKPAADGPRYRALGNSMAVPCVRWILTRLIEIAAMSEERTPCQ